MRDHAQSRAQPAGVQYPGRRYLGICGAKIGCAANVERQPRRPPNLGDNGADVLVAYERQQVASRPAGRSRRSMFGGNRRTTLNRSRATRDMRVASETDDAGCRQLSGIALRVSPRCHPGTRKVVGAAGFEPASASDTAGRPATPCAQGERTLTTGGKRPLPLVFLRNFAIVATAGNLEPLPIVSQLSAKAELSPKM